MFTEQQEKELKQLVSRSTDAEITLIELKKYIRGLHETKQLTVQHDPDWLAWFVYLQYKKQLKNENVRPSYR